MSSPEWLPHGEGVYSQGGGATWVGTFKAGDIVEGLVTYPSGDRYQGLFSSDWKRHGQGVYQYKDGHKGFGPWRYDNLAIHQLAENL